MDILSRALRERERERERTITDTQEVTEGRRERETERFIRNSPDGGSRALPAHTDMWKCLTASLGLVAYLDYGLGWK